MNRVLSISWIIFVFLLSFSQFIFSQNSLWKNIGPEGGYVIDLQFSKSNPQIVYALIDGGDIYRSEDYGESWNRSGWHEGAKFIYVSDHDEDILFTANTSPESRGLYKSSDGGANCAGRSAGQ